MDNLSGRLRLLSNAANILGPVLVSGRRDDGTLPVNVLTWTWREAIEIAVRAPSRAEVRRQDGRWGVSWRAKPIAIN